MSDSTLRSEQEAVAVERILDAAGEAFEATGPRKASMEEVARRAGCSRATLYKYFANRQMLRVAYVNREALVLAADLTARLATVDDPAQRIVEGITSAVSEVRARPTLSVWFTEPELGVTTAISADSEVLDAIASGFLAGLPGGPEIARSRLRGGARWVIRVIVSLLAMPLEDADAERALVEDFVVPSLIGAVGRR